MDKSNAAVVRAHNERLILEHVLEHQPVSRAELSRSTKLNKVSVSEIVSTLLTEGLIRETGSGESSGGRRPVLLEQNRERALVFVINLAPDELTAAAAWLDGSFLFEPLSREIDIIRDDVVGLLEDEVNFLMDRCREITEDYYLAPDIAGLTIAIHGNVYNNDILFTPYYDLKGLELARKLETIYPFPVYLHNEANLSALGELSLTDPGADFISISIHSGIGGGLIRGGKLDVGQQGFSGEIGHMIVRPEGISCPCGNHGCIEQYASDRALRLLYRKRSGKPTARFRDIIEAYRRLDPDAIVCIQQFTEYMAILINNVIRLLDPSSVILHSRITAALPEVIPSIERQIKCEIKSGTRIRTSRLGDLAVLYGGIYQAAIEYYQVGHLHLRPERSLRS